MKKIKDYYFVIIPIVITLLLYSVSITYGFRNFDEDVLIKNFYTNKTFGEYVERFLLTNASGGTEAHGFTFSSIKNVHVGILSIPLFYLINFLFQAKPYLFHLWGMLLHCLALYFFTWFCFNLTSNKNIAFIAGLLWTLHPTNIEPIIWATNWTQLFALVLYFFTLNKIILLIKDDTPSRTTTMFIVFITLIQILFSEHTITIPFAIFLTIMYFLKYTNKVTILNTAFKTSLPAFLIILGYWIFRNALISKATSSSAQNNFGELIERLIFLSPQVFLHQLKLIFFPLKLTIDQIDLLNLDKILSIYNLFCVFIAVLFILMIWSLKDKLSYLSYGLLMYLITILPFLQIIPLYSVVGERYNYFGSAFLVFGIVSILPKIEKSKAYKLVLILPLIICLLLGTRSYIRIKDWKDSSSLFLSTINISKSLLKKGIWTYNLAITQEDEERKNELLRLSTNLLNLFIQGNSDESLIRRPLGASLQQYELDTKSLLAKASMRIATNYEILNELYRRPDGASLQHEYLLQALDFSRPNTQIQSLIYKDLGTFYFQENNFIKAIDYYNKSILISPNPTIDYAIAVCYLKLNAYSNYEKYLEKASSVISPYNVSPFKTYGQFLELSKNDIKKAIKYYKIASLLEDKVEPYILLAGAHSKQGQIDQAFKVVRNGLHSFPENSTLTYLQGVIQVSKGNINEGKINLTKVVNKKDTTADIKIEACNILVNIFLKENDFKNASIYNKIALSIDPINKEALNHRKIINKKVNKV